MAAVARARPAARRRHDKQRFREHSLAIAIAIARK